LAIPAYIFLGTELFCVHI